MMGKWRYIEAKESKLMKSGEEGMSSLWFTKTQYFHIHVHRLYDLYAYRTGEREEPIHFLPVQFVQHN